MKLKHLCTVGMLLNICLLLGGQTLNEIHTEGPRPLNEALQQIEDALKKPLFYEEIPHENMADLVSGAEVGMNPHSYYLRSRKLDVIVGDNSSLVVAVNNVLATYTSQSLPGSYAMVSFGTMTAVIPQSMTNKAGATITVHSILETPITLPKVSRTRAETLAAIVNAMSVASHRPIDQLPLASDYKKIVFGADNEASGSVLSRLEEDFGPFTCHLLYDPPSRQYYANFQWIAPRPVEQTPVLGPKKDNPYFIRVK